MTRLPALASALALLAGAPAAALVVSASPDVTLDLSGTTVRDREAVLDDLMGGLIVDDFGGLPDGVDVVALNEELGARVLFSTDATVALPGPLTARPSDVVRTNGSTYVLEFQGSAHGVPDGVGVDAVARAPTGELVLSFDVSLSLGGVRADDEDLVSFDGTSFALLLDASAEGVDPALDLDGAAYVGQGRYAVSFDGTGSLDGVDFADEDVVTLRPGGPDALLFFDASAVHPQWADADLDAVALPEPGALGGAAAALALLAALARKGGRSWRR